MPITGTDAAGRLGGLGLLFCLASAGCSGTTVLRPGQNFYLEEPGVLVKKDGGRLEVQKTLVRNDTLVFTDAREGRKMSMPAADAERIMTVNRVQGAWQGFLLFAAAGAVLGAIPDPDCGDPCLFPNGGVVGSVFIAVVAAPIGATFGALMGRRRTLIFEHPPQSPDSGGGKDVRP